MCLIVNLNFTVLTCSAVSFGSVLGLFSLKRIVSQNGYSFEGLSPSNNSLNIQLYNTSGVWPRVRARALSAPVFFGSLPRPTGRCAPLHPLQLRCSPQTKKNYFQKQNVSIQAQTRAARCICFPTGLRCALLSYAVPS